MVQERGAHYTSAGEVVNGAWKTVASVRGNYMRRREHQFYRVQADRLRLTVLATNGAPAARVYEVRVY